MQINWLRTTRQRLANADSLLHMSAIGVLSGISCALIVLLFRLLIEVPSSLWLPGNNPENFEGLPVWLYFCLPLAGSFILGLILTAMEENNTRTGIAHVITRVHAHHGHMPIKNALVQFFGGAFAIATGQSAGREGPAIHLGAATNSLLGQLFKLPNNSLRLLVACGTAAAIAASFNTPIAGVILAMEVIMLEYTVASFIPVILAAITGTIMTRAFYSSDKLFSIPGVEIVSLWEIPYIAFLGLVAGCCAAFFIGTLKFSLRLSHKPVLLRMTLAGLVTGCCALLVPQIMGLGYDSLNAALLDELSITILLALIAAKIIATAISAGLGMPIGIIGPSLLIGACIGGALGSIGASIFPDQASHHAFYVLLGMGAMMGAILNAPLAALMALLELSSDTGVIFPGMLAITIASLTNSELFKQRSAHRTMLQHQQQLLLTDPLSLALQRTSVASLMHRSISAQPRLLPITEAQQLQTEHFDWYVIDEDNGERLSLIKHDQLQHGLEKALNTEPAQSIDLLAIADKALPLAELHIQATLKEAMLLMNEKNIDALYISGYLSGPFPDNGIITREDIDNYSSAPQAS